jgi:hypothetical protein
VAVPSTGLAVAWVLDEDIDMEIPGRTISANEILLASCVSLPVAIVGLRRGFRLVRRGRTLVLFLRRFGHDEAMSAVTFAVTRTIGSNWRVVTLDDAEIAPVGVATGARRFFGTVSLAGSILSGALNLLLRVFPAAQLALWLIVAIDLVRNRIWERARDPQAWLTVVDPYFTILFSGLEGRLPFEALGLHLHGAFALMMIVLTGIVLALGAALAAAPLGWLFGALFLFFFSFSAADVRQAERSKTREIRTDTQVRTAAYDVARGSRKVFGPRLVVLRVATAVWRETVSRFAAACSVSLIDVSEPTEHLIWEIEHLAQARTRCVFIGHYDRVAALATSSNPPEPAVRQLASLLEWQQILAYTTDRKGMKRFARALRSKLLTLSSEPGFERAHVVR